MDKKGIILVVDDDPDIVATSRIILESNGYEVQTAANGKDAVSLLSRIKPDLVMLDVMMTSDTEGFDSSFQAQGRPGVQGSADHHVDQLSRQGARGGTRSL